MVGAGVIGFTNEPATSAAVGQVLVNGLSVVDPQVRHEATAFPESAEKARWWNHRILAAVTQPWNK
jgi:hypothetical protein